MSGVASKIPRGWRNIQVVNLKTVDSIALPVFNSLPPEPKLLAPIEEEGPKRKRVKLDDSAPLPTSTLVVREQEEDSEEVVSVPSPTSPVSGSAGGRVPGDSSREEVAATDTPAMEKRKLKVCLDVGRLSRSLSSSVSLSLFLSSVSLTISLSLCIGKKCSQAGHEEGPRQYNRQLSLRENDKTEVSRTQIILTDLTLK